MVLLMALRFLGHRALATSMGKSQEQGLGLLFTMTFGLEMNLCTILVIHYTLYIKRERKKGSKGGRKGMRR